MTTTADYLTLRGSICKLHAAELYVPELWPGTARTHRAQPAAWPKVILRDVRKIHRLVGIFTYTEQRIFNHIGEHRHG